MAEDAALAFEPRGPRHAFSPLRERNFRLLWTGLLVSQTGSWMQFIAQGYLVDQLTKAPIYLGLLGLSQAVPRLMFAFIGGVAADRLDRRRVLLVTNISMMASAVLLTVLAFTDRGGNLRVVCSLDEGHGPIDEVTYVCDELVVDFRLQLIQVEVRIRLPQRDNPRQIESQVVRGEDLQEILYLEPPLPAL